MTVEVVTEDTPPGFADPAANSPTSPVADDWEPGDTNSHGNGHGNGHGNAHGNAHGNGHGNAHGYGHSNGPVIATEATELEPDAEAIAPDERQSTEVNPADAQAASDDWDEDWDKAERSPDQPTPVTPAVVAPDDEVSDRNWDDEDEEGNWVDGDLDEDWDDETPVMRPVKMTSSLFSNPYRPPNS